MFKKVSTWTMYLKSLRCFDHSDSPRIEKKDFSAGRFPFFSEKYWADLLSLYNCFTGRSPRVLGGLLQLYFPSKYLNRQVQKLSCCQNKHLTTWWHITHLSNISYLKHWKTNTHFANYLHILKVWRFHYRVKSNY